MGANGADGGGRIQKQVWVQQKVYFREFYVEHDVNE